MARKTKKGKKKTKSRRKSARKTVKTKAKRDKKSRSVVGDLVNFRGLVYSPINELAVVFLFGKVAADLNMYVEEIKAGFPDCIARRYTGKGWERVAVEFEYKSSSFRQHKHDHKQCDIIVCWEHDWPTCPIEVIELKERIKELENTEITRPGDAPTGPQGDIADWFKRHGIQKKVMPLFDKLWDLVRKKDDAIFYKVGEKLVSIYSPERVFIYMWPRKSMLRMNMFTGGKRLGKVKQFEYERGAEKWGGISISSEKELTAAIPWVMESIKRIKKSIKNNEPTGWYAKIDSDEE